MLRVLAAFRCQACERQVVIPVFREDQSGQQGQEQADSQDVPSCPLKRCWFDVLLSSSVAFPAKAESCCFRHCATAEGTVKVREGDP